MRVKVKTRPKNKTCFCCKKTREGTIIDEKHVCNSCNFVSKNENKKKI